MKVHLKRQWFCPGGYRIRQGYRDIPEEYRKALPEDAKIVESDSVAADPEPEMDTFSEMAHYDPARQAAEDEARVHAEVAAEAKADAAWEKQQKAAAPKRKRSKGDKDA